MVAVVVVEEGVAVEVVAADQSSRHLSHHRSQTIPTAPRIGRKAQPEAPQMESPRKKLRHPLRLDRNGMWL